ncbi:MAG: (d)CMP kinase [Lachnospiraceae bacterium]
MSINVAIDGPAGAGKSTIAKRIAKQLNYIYVDTGAMYRAMALYILREGVMPQDTERISMTCIHANIEIQYQNGEQIVLLNGENVNGLIRTEEVGKMASVTSVNQDVRFKLLELQRQLAKKADVIMDGRDIGTYVLPDADVKIYLTAGSHVRALRRYEELIAKGEPAQLETIEQDIKERDHRDMTRELAPLKQAEDATVVDTSDMSIEEVIRTILAIIQTQTQR